MDLDARAVVTLTKPETKISHVSLKAGSISTVRTESIATLADGSLNKWVTGDSAVLSEVLVNVYNKPVTDAVPITELYKSAYSKPVDGDSVSLADVFARVVTWNRELSDAFTLDDAAQIDKDYFGNKGNITQLLDELNIVLSTNYADSYSVNDVLNIVMLYAQNPNHSVSVGDVPVIRNRSGSLMNGTFFNNITLN
mgnify:CR=1 FL=1|tara:strand:+ start:468 stop:1055 length:588 start_codon:yes stop_codon:yes gene_type:complete